jgi:hypothetical protein
MWKNKLNNLVMPDGSDSLDFCTYKPVKKDKKILVESGKINTHLGFVKCPIANTF